MQKMQELVKKKFYDHHKSVQQIWDEQKKWKYLGVDHDYIVKVA